MIKGPKTTVFRCLNCDKIYEEWPTTLVCPICKYTSDIWAYEEEGRWQYYWYRFPKWCPDWNEPVREITEQHLEDEWL